MEQLPCTADQCLKILFDLIHPEYVESVTLNKRMYDLIRERLADQLLMTQSTFDQVYPYGYDMWMVGQVRVLLDEDTPNPIVIKWADFKQMELIRDFNKGD